MEVSMPNSFRKPMLHTAVMAIGLLCGIAVQAQTPLVAADPGSRPPGLHAKFQVADTHGNTIPDFAQPVDSTVNSAGNFLPNLTADQRAFWFAGLAIFGDIASVQGVPRFVASTEPIGGLGPGFNGNSCFMCHSEPAIGGSGPGPGSPLFTENPQLLVAHHRGASNPEDLSSILTPSGPVREVRFVLNPDGSFDGGVHELFTIAGRDDAPSTCTLAQPNFNTQLANNNAIFRIPIATFGEGFVENTPEKELHANLIANGALKTSLGIQGRFNTNGNDGTFTRFGWKAQNKSMLLFSGEASNVEMGVTNEIFQNEKLGSVFCVGNQLPEDLTNIIPRATLAGLASDGAAASAVSSNIENFAVFMRLNAAPAQCDFASGLDANNNAVCNPLSASALRGKALFGIPTTATPNAVSCVLCHSDHLVTGPSSFTDLNNATFAPFSDFALHHMGSTLTDGVNQGLAGPDEFRTAPLWGLGQRIFLLHDGRTTDLLAAIQDHASPSTDCTSTSTAGATFKLNGQNIQLTALGTQFCGSEANQVINNFNLLNPADQLDLLHFLRSL
jgi:CxxC motif-containing protein (DUF1111 family)